MEKELRKNIGFDMQKDIDSWNNEDAGSIRDDRLIVNGIEYPNPEGNWGTPHSGCSVCRNLLKVGNQSTEEGWTCRAFPDGIPWEICLVQGDTSHDVPYPGDNGYRYSPEVFEFKGHKFKWKFDLTGAELVE